MSPETCRRCGREVLRGATEAPGFEVLLDPVELDARLELDATLAGVTTVTHHTRADRLAIRGAWAIRHSPAGSHPRQVVYPLHTCTRTGEDTPR